MAEFSKFNGYTVKDAIARNIAKGRNQALAYADYATMVETLNAMDNEQFKIGQNIYIGTVGVPDLWVYSIEPVFLEQTASIILMTKLETDIIKKDS